MTSETTTVTGTVRLNLITNPATPGNLGIHIGQTGDKIGFFGHTPIARPTGIVVSVAAPPAGSYQASITENRNKLNALILALTNSGANGLGLLSI